MSQAEALCGAVNALADGLRRANSILSDIIDNQDARVLDIHDSLERARGFLEKAGKGEGAAAPAP